MPISLPIMLFQLLIVLTIIGLPSPLYWFSAFLWGGISIIAIRTSALMSIQLVVVVISFLIKLSF